MKPRTSILTLCINAALISVAPIAAHAQQASTTTSTTAVAPGAATATQTTTMSATVTGIDPVARVVTLKRQDGKIVMLTASDEVRNFAQIKIGDQVNASYTQALSLQLRKGSGTQQGAATESLTRSALGAKPAGVAGREVTVIADVVAIDAANRAITLRGPRGNEVDLEVRDPAQLANIKVGDQVEAVYTEALAIAVEAAQPVPAK